MLGLNIRARRLLQAGHRHRSAGRPPARCTPYQRQYAPIRTHCAGTRPLPELSLSKHCAKQRVGRSTIPVNEEILSVKNSTYQETCLIYTRKSKLCLDWKGPHGIVGCHPCHGEPSSLEGLVSIRTLAITRQAILGRLA